MTNTALLQIKKDNEWRYVTLSDTVPFPLTFNIADVRDINNRNSAYTKTVVLPGDDNNNDLFEYIFDVQSIESYDVRKKVKFFLTIDTVPILEGYIQLNNINCDDNKYWTYECILYGENANFAKTIDQNAKLEDLDLSDFNHDFNLSTVTASWYGTWEHGYYYPVIDYNNGRELHQTNFHFNWKLPYLRPALYVKQYWNKIFETYGYSWESDFLNSDAFNNLIIPFNSKSIQNDAVWRYNSSFRAGLTQSVAFSTKYGYEFTPYSSPTDPAITTTIQIGFNTPLPTNMEDLLSLDEVAFPNFDPGGNFTQTFMGDFYYQNNYQNQYAHNQTLVLNLDFDFTVTFFDPTTPYDIFELLGTRLVMYCEVIKNGNIVATKTLLNYGGSYFNYPVNPNYDVSTNQYIDQLYGPATTWSYDFFGRQVLQVSVTEAEIGGIGPGDIITFKLGAFSNRIIVNNSAPFTQQRHWLQTKFNFLFHPTNDTVNGTYFYNIIDPILAENQPLNIVSAVPKNIKQIDFINSIIKMFNLYLLQDKIDPNKIFIEPRDQFYTQNSILNWSRLLDTDKTIGDIPIVDRKKRVLMTYKEDKDKYNSYYKQDTGEIYGEKEYLTGNEIDITEQKIDVIFSPTPLSMRAINDLVVDHNFIYSQILDPKEINAENFNKIESNIRILYRKTIPVSSETFILGSGFLGSYTFSIYPYAGHLDDPYNSTLDLSWAEPKQFYFTNDNGYTQNGLFNQYYNQFFEEIYGKESKQITAYLYLNSQDILDFDYRKLIYMDNLSSGAAGYFRVNKIEYDPFVKNSYKVEFIKVLNNIRPLLPKKILINQILPHTTDSIVGPAVGINQGHFNILHGENNLTQASNGIISGLDNSIKDFADNSLVIGASQSTSGKNSMIAAGGSNCITGSGVGASIISGLSSSNSSPYSSIIASKNSKTYFGSQYSAIIGGEDNTIFGKSPDSILLGGIGNSMGSYIAYGVGTFSNGVYNSMILGGMDNSFINGVTNSIIIGGTAFTGTMSNTVYLEGNVIINGISASNVLQNAVLKNTVNTIVPSVFDMTFSGNSRIEDISKYTGLLTGDEGLLLHAENPGSGGGFVDIATNIPSTERMRLRADESGPSFSSIRIDNVEADDTFTSMAEFRRDNRMGFFGVSPVAQQNMVTAEDALVNLGFLINPISGTGSGGSGPQGLQGNTGSQGIMGSTGLSGTGVQGPQGSTGSNGITGSQGPQGLSGTGSTGTQGFQGPTGPFTAGNSVGDTPYWVGGVTGWVGTSSFIYNDGVKVGIGPGPTGPSFSSFSAAGSTILPLLNVTTNSTRQGVLIDGQGNSNRTLVKIFNGSIGSAAVTYRSVLVVGSNTNDFGASYISSESTSEGNGVTSGWDISTGVFGNGTSRFVDIFSFGKNYNNSAIFTSAYFAGSTLFWASGDQGTGTQSNMIFLLANYQGSSLANTSTDRFFAFSKSVGSGALGASNEIMRIGANDRVGILDKRRGLTASSTLHVGGSYALKEDVITATTTLGETQSVVYAQATSANITLNLPVAATAYDRIYHVKKIDSTTFSVIIDPNAAQTIDGTASYTLTNRNDAITFQSDGTAWQILSNFSGTSATASSGPQGVQGFQGIAGPTGQTGVQGLIGPTGPDNPVWEQIYQFSSGGFGTTSVTDVYDVRLVDYTGTASYLLGSGTPFFYLKSQKILNSSSQLIMGLNSNLNPNLISIGQKDFGSGTPRLHNVYTDPTFAGTASVSSVGPTTINTSVVDSSLSKIFITSRTSLGIGDNFYVDNLITSTSFDINMVSTFGGTAIVNWMIIN